MELANVEVFDNEIKLTFMYTNRMRGPQYARPAGQVYLVDNLGNRYPYANDSIENPRQWPPQIPVKFSITFAKAMSGASSVNLILPWYAADAGGEVVQAPRLGMPDSGPPTIAFRLIPLPVAPAAAQGFRYNHQLFTLELKDVEVVDDAVRINPTYPNRTSRPQSAGIAAGGAYLVDDLGNRYKYISDSFSRTRSDFPPPAPEEIWISFDKLRPGSSSLNLVLSWRARDAEPVSVTFRGVPLPQ